MMKFLKYLLIAVIAIAAVAFLGPRPDTSVSLTFDKNSLGEDLDAYLAQSEQDIPNLVDGTQKEIIWNNPGTKEQTEFAIVNIHGFSGTKHEIRPVVDNVAKGMDANLYLARMTGHGRDGNGMLDGSISAWADDFAEAIAIGERLGKKIIVFATSNGAPISLMGLNNPELSKNVAAIVFVAPNFGLKAITTDMANIPWAETVLPILMGDEVSWEGGNELHNKWWTTQYPSRAIFPMTALLKVTSGYDLSKMTIPAMFIYSPLDDVVTVEGIEKAVAAWGGAKDTIIFEEKSDVSDHVIIGDITNPQNTSLATYSLITWLQNIGL